jgi:hypothetical protein
MPGTYIQDAQVWDGAAMVPGWIDSEGAAHVGDPRLIVTPIVDAGAGPGSTDLVTGYLNVYGQPVKADGSPLYETIIEGHRFYYDHTTGKLEYPPELTAHEIHLLLDRYPTAGGGIPQPWDYDDPIQHTQARGDVDYLFGFLPSGTLSALISTALKVAGAEIGMALSTPSPAPDGTLSGGAGSDTLAGGALRDTLADAPGAADLTHTYSPVPLADSIGAFGTGGDLVQGLATGGAPVGADAVAPVAALIAPTPEFTLAQPGDLIRYNPPTDAGGGSLSTVVAPDYTIAQPGDLLHYAPKPDAGGWLPTWGEVGAALGVGKAALGLAQEVTASGTPARATTIPANGPARPTSSNPGSLGYFSDYGAVGDETLSGDAGTDTLQDAGSAGLLLGAAVAAGLLYALMTR